MTSCDQSAGAKQDIPSPLPSRWRDLNFDFYHYVQMSEPCLFFCALSETLAVAEFLFFFPLKRPEVESKKGKRRFFFLLLLSQSNVVSYSLF